MACCSLQQELGAWCHAEGTSYISGITMDAEGVGWSLRYFLPPLGFLDAVVPHAVVSTASKAPMGLGSCRAVELWAQLLLCIMRCGVRSKRGCREVRPLGTGGIGVTWDGSGNVGLSRGEVFLAGVTCSRAGVSPENQTLWHARFLQIPQSDGKRGQLGIHEDVWARRALLSSSPCPSPLPTLVTSNSIFTICRDWLNLSAFLPASPPGHD